MSGRGMRGGVSKRMKQKWEIHLKASYTCKNSARQKKSRGPNKRNKAS